MTFFYAGPKKNWGFLKFTGKVPANAVKGKVILRFFPNKTKNGVYIDSVLFRSGK